jgi:hypothetical protein
MNAFAAYLGTNIGDADLFRRHQYISRYFGVCEVPLYLTFVVLGSLFLVRHY